MSTDDRFRVDLLAASLRANASDLVEFTELLARKLVSALPGYTRVERRRTTAFGPKRVARVMVTLPHERLELVILEGIVEARCARISGGIALKHETLEFNEWVDRLSGALADEAERSEQARQGLSDLLS